MCSDFVRCCVAVGTVWVICVNCKLESLAGDRGQGTALCCVKQYVCDTASSCGMMNWEERQRPWPVARFNVSICGKGLRRAKENVT